MFIARKASHIEDDLKRNWSSWSFGAYGFEGDRDQLVAAIEECRDSAFPISGFEVWIDEDASIQVDGDEVRVAGHKLRQLYPNYWVSVDEVNARGGLSCIYLDAETLEDAIEEAKDGFFAGDGEVFKASEAILRHTIEQEDGAHIHILEILD